LDECGWLATWALHRRYHVPKHLAMVPQDSIYAQGNSIHILPSLCLQ
jgi:hypothetical protein